MGVAVAQTEFEFVNAESMPDGFWNPDAKVLGAELPLTVDCRAALVWTAVWLLSGKATTNPHRKFPRKYQLIIPAHNV